MTRKKGGSIFKKGFVFLLLLWLAMGVPLPVLGDVPNQSFGSRTLSRGMAGNDVFLLQVYLKKLHYYFQSFLI